MAQSRRWVRIAPDKGEAQVARVTVLTPVEARQGVVSGRVSLILAVSLILSALAFVVVYSAI